MDEKDIFEAMRKGSVLAINVQGIEHIRSDPNTFLTATLYNFEGRIVPEGIWSDDLTEETISKVISRAAAEFKPLWSAFDYELIQGVPVAPAVRYYSAMEPSKPIWMATPKAP